MKIIFARLNLALDLKFDHDDAHQALDFKVPFLRSLVDAGHEITIKSPLSSREIKHRSHTHVDFFGSDDSDWRKKLGYNLEFDDVDDYDLMILENASPNTLFSFNRNGETVSYMKHASELIDAYSGKIKYLQHFPDFEFPFGDAVSDGTGRSPSNLKNIFSEKSVFENKEWELLLTLKNFELFKTNGVRSKMTYEDFEDRVKFKYLPVCYYKKETPRLEVLENPEWDNTWVGGEAGGSRNKYGVNDPTSRYENVKKFYSDPRYTSLIVGRWKRDFPNATFGGEVGGGHLGAMKLQQNAYICVLTCSQRTKDLQFFTTRPFQVPLSGAVVLYDKEFSHYGDYVEEKYAVTNADDVYEWVKTIKSLSFEERKNLINDQIKDLPTWDMPRIQKIILE